MSNRRMSRGKRKDNKEWVTGYLLADTAPCRLKKEGKCGCPHDGSDAYIFTWRDELHEYDEYEIDSESAGQCTGLHDKYDEPVFEGDIVKNQRSGSAPHSIIVWNTYEWCKKDEYGLHPIHQKEIEIVGNIHDNPELLKGA